MEKISIKAGAGRLRGVSNDYDQEGKVLRIYDGTILLAILELDKAFPDRVCTPDDTIDTGTEPGKMLDMPFTSNLRTETDGDGISVYWQ